MTRHHPDTVARARIIARIAGAIVGVIVGVLYATFILSNSPGVVAADATTLIVVLIGSGVVGSASLALAAPMLSVEPYLRLETILDEASTGQLVGALGGVISGLVIAALVGVILAPLPYGAGTIISVALAVALVDVGAHTGARQRTRLDQLVGEPAASPAPAPRAGASSDAGVLVDTSAIIDGRLLEVVRSGFLAGPLLVPSFVLEELQRVADSGDPMRRARGRRGLDVLEELQSGDRIACQLLDLDFPGTSEVDARLVRAAAERGCPLLTTDYNLNRVARAAGVHVLNINELANALKPILIAGQEIAIAIVKEGRELHQGVGYLEDGTMVVVEGARRQLGQTVRATVTSVLQTPAGRMIFAALEANLDEARPRTGRSRAAAR